MDLPEAPASIHREGDPEEFLKPLFGSMATESHRAYDRRELLEVRLFRRKQGCPLEERDNPLEQILLPSHDKDQDLVLRPLRLM